MAHRQLDVALLMALKRDTLVLHQAVVLFDSDEAQGLSDQTMDILRAAARSELRSCIATSTGSYVCRFCPYATQFWTAQP
jgi:hypothetical protein